GASDRVVRRKRLRGGCTAQAMGFQYSSERGRWSYDLGFRLSSLLHIAQGPVWEQAVEDESAVYLGPNRSIRQTDTPHRRHASRQTVEPELSQR
ncbi:MAG: hypothetical protein ACJ72H_02150, partial [Candidatus Sulfotelmatobacter sp.]